MSKRQRRGWGGANIAPCGSSRASLGYELRIDSQAAKYLRRLDRKTQQRIVQRLGELGENPHDPAFSKPLRGPGGRRSARVGGYRIIFSVDDEAAIVSAALIGPRRRAYRDRN
ncbi:MAG: type II toxin-antitoxin system RelE/ParE family toxin [Dehalococcoidia bacterium]|nr:type II toxin-antitoxin system RelE/ParE family toxin [Dehalococcoidia bacterium]